MEYNEGGHAEGEKETKYQEEVEPLLIGVGYNKEAQVPGGVLEGPPTPPGGYIDPNYHILIKTASLQQTWEDGVLAFLESENIDHEEPDVAKRKVSCVSFHNGGRVPFFVRIFTLDTALVNKYGDYAFAVEFQRRSGDIFHFSSVFRRAKAFFANKRLVLGNRTNIPIELDLPPLDCEEPLESQWEETETCLRDMADSQRFDIEVQAVQALSQLPHSGGNARKALRTRNTLGYLVNKLSHQAEDIHRCALAGIASILEYEAYPEDMATVLSREFFDLAAQSDTRQVVRECLRVLQALHAVASLRPVLLQQCLHDAKDIVQNAEGMFDLSKLRHEGPVKTTLEWLRKL